MKSTAQVCRRAAAYICEVAHPRHDRHADGRSSIDRPLPESKGPEFTGLRSNGPDQNAPELARNVPHDVTGQAQSGDGASFSPSAAASAGADLRALDVSPPNWPPGLSATPWRPLAALIGADCGGAAVAQGRQIAMDLTHIAFEMSLKHVALALAQERSTVAQACHRMEDRCEDPAFDCWIESMEATLRAAPASLAGSLAGLEAAP